MYGRVKKYFHDRNYGFIRGEDGNTYFVLRSNLKGEYIDSGYYVSCYACNQFKSNILPDDFMDRIIKIFLYQTEKKCSKDMKLKIIHKLVETL